MYVSVQTYMPRVDTLFDQSGHCCARTRVCKWMKINIEYWFRPHFRYGTFWYKWIVAVHEQSTKNKRNDKYIYCRQKINVYSLHFRNVSSNKRWNKMTHTRHRFVFWSSMWSIFRCLIHAWRVRRYYVTESLLKYCALSLSLSLEKRPLNA